MPRSTAHDFDLHGFVGVRLLNASESDRRAVRRQLGPLESPLGRDPDIVIRFVERLRITAPLRLLGVDEAGFTDDAFLVLRSRRKTAARVRIPFEEIGGRCEILCESGLSAVPLLVPIINLTALAKGFVPLHASAFTYRGTGVVSTGWSKGGKTEMLLAFLNRGAEYVGDEWVYLSPDGRQVYGIPEPVRVWDWHLRQLADLRARIGVRTRLRLRGLELCRSLSERLASLGAHRRGAGIWTRVAALLRKQAHVDVPSEVLTGNARGPRSATFDRLLFVISGESPEVTVEPIDPAEVARRMVHSLEYERSALLGYYRMFRFASPERSNPLLEQAEPLGRELLERALAGKPASAVCHPYPVQFSDLFDCVAPLLVPPAIPALDWPVPSEPLRVLEASQA